MPIGLVAPQPLNAGVTPTPLVAPAENVISTDAVSALVDAYRKGVITSNDVSQHSGIMATLRNRQEAQKIREDVSPSAIQARESARQATIAQNQFNQQAAQAQTGLIQPTAQAAGLKVGQEAAATVMGPQGMQAIQQYGPWFGESPDDYRNKDGSYDFMSAAKRGNQMSAQMNLANMWIDRLTPVGDRKLTDAAGGEHVAKVNKFGIDVTPPMPENNFQASPAYNAYVKELNQFLPDFHPARAQFMMKAPTRDGSGVAPGTSAPPTPTSDASLVQPNTPATQAAPAVIQPATSADVAAPATIMPAGIQTVAPKGSYQTPSEIRASMTQEPALKTFQEQSKYANNFKTIANNMETVGATQPGTSVPPQNANDLGLVESLIKLYDPQATIREFKWEKFEQDQPRLEQLKNWTQTVLKNGTLTPQARARLINMGDEVVNSMEGTARDRLGLAKNVAESSAKVAGQNPQDWVNQTFTGDEQRIMRGEPFRTPKKPAAPSAAAAASAGKRVVTFKTGPYAGHPMIDNGDGSFSPAQ